MKRNANGNGSVRKISVARGGKTYTYWQARYSAGFDPGTGKQKQHSITGKTQKEVLQKLKAATAAIDNGSYIEPSAMTVAQWLQSWSDNYLEGIKPSTAYLYRRSIALYLTPNLGAVKLCALKTQQIQAFYNDLLRPGKKNAEPLSPKTIKNIHGILHKALQQAVANGDIRQNPADACSLPKVVRKEMTVFDDDAAAAFLRAIDGHPHELLYKIALFTGMREGELLGLTWDCIDFTNGTISVRQQARQEQKKGGQYYFPHRKTERGASWPSRRVCLPCSVRSRTSRKKWLPMPGLLGTMYTIWCLPMRRAAFCHTALFMTASSESSSQSAWKPCASMIFVIAMLLLLSKMVTISKRFRKTSAMRRQRLPWTYTRMRQIR